MTRFSPRDLLLLALLTLFWGFNWPVMKLGVAELPPLLFRTLCLGGGLVVIGAWARARGISLVVPPGAWREIAWLAVPNMIVWHVLAILAIKMLPSGRAAILGYTMPVWAVLAASCSSARGRSRATGSASRRRCSARCCCCRPN